MTAPKRPPGRPPRLAKISDERIEVRISRNERHAWEAAAKKERLSLSEWIRQRCNR